MEEGVSDIDQFYQEREGRALINFGATIGHEYLRAAVAESATQMLRRETPRIAA
jgi:hypothetical protein